MFWFAQLRLLTGPDFKNRCDQILNPLRSRTWPKLIMVYSAYEKPEMEEQQLPLNIFYIIFTATS
jgi:hypothetical protein